MKKIVRKHGTERMSKIVIHNDIVYLCGQVGVSDTPLQDQAKEMLSRVDQLLEEAGTDKTRMLSATVYLSDMRYFTDFNKIWDAWAAPSAAPARACVEARIALPGLFCEVSVTAALP
ncbi:MAG: RidA family protein [Desulfobacula sp.]|jgi:enamine deaminase RidA (YjgF/YER057c/UK114 family)|uniref:RidA family protein n=1 Tax=Desulfobacula sp. TaxID=2593537 RepID=UPI001DC31F88|nr:RidA family protein [Deltaproteobacteria bacterium]MBT3487009.1 RidA family protein [Desulfobacula sp.]MBT4025877.1 RidA family protein [Desulfobacula sp.]MBT4878086.1 RidA family protein [Desulfobacula sp.]MBT5545511.1 RidA family protein [Desulfobacula sp.]